MLIICSYFNCIFNLLHQLRAYTLFRKFTSLLNFNFYCHQAVGQEWDAIHLYIAKNIDWMKVWIERCAQSSHGISWEGVASLVKSTLVMEIQILQKGKSI